LKTVARPVSPMRTRQRSLVLGVARRGRMIVGRLPAEAPAHAHRCYLDLLSVTEGECGSMSQMCLSSPWSLGCYGHLHHNWDHSLCLALLVLRSRMNLCRVPLVLWYRACDAGSCRCLLMRSCRCLLVYCCSREVNNCESRDCSKYSDSIPGPDRNANAVSSPSFRDLSSVEVCSRKAWFPRRRGACVVLRRRSVCRRQWTRRSRGSRRLLFVLNVLNGRLVG
jgi:hypothetical protein